MRRLLAVLGACTMLAFGSTALSGEKKPNQGTLEVAGKTYRLASALAYEQKAFNRPEIVIILSEKPLDTAKLKQSFKKNGNDDDFFPTEPHVKLSFDDRGGLLQLTIVAGGANIIRSGDPNVKADATIQDGHAQGTAGMKKPDTFRDRPLSFEAAFDVALLALSGAPSEAKPPLPPKAKVKTKSTTTEPGRASPAVEKELRFEGEVAEDTPEVMGKPAQIHKVKMTGGKTYLIDLESKEFDVYLRVLDAAGKQLASDDDGGENLNARLRFRPAREGNYQVVATRFGNREGDYLLKVRVMRVGEEK